MTTEEGVVTTEKTADELVGRVFEATLGMMDILSMHLGDRLGLYRALRDGGPATVDDLAARVGIDRRYAREWLEQQAVTGLLEVDDVAADADDRRYRLPHAYAEPLLDRDSPYSIAPLARSAAAYARVMPELVDAFRTGGGVAWSDYGADMIEAQGDFNRPWLMGSFGTEMLPAIPDIAERLAADPPARVVDIACGVGWAAIAIARAYPTVRVDGFDLDPSSIELARQHARDAGVDDRVTFEAANIAHARGGRVRPGGGHRGDPRHDPAGRCPRVDPSPARDRTGSLLVADEKSEDAFTAPGRRARALLLRVQHPDLPAGRHDRTADGGDRDGPARRDHGAPRAGGRVPERRATRRARDRDAPLLPADALGTPRGTTIDVQRYRTGGVTMDFNNILIGSDNPEALVDYYTKLLGEPAMSDGGYTGWAIGRRLHRGRGAFGGPRAEHRAGTADLEHLDPGRQGDRREVQGRRCHRGRGAVCLGDGRVPDHLDRHLRRP